MQNLPLISVIVPVYGVENYIDDCVRSLVEQTYPNLQLIFIDDGSPDNCPQMLDSWAEKDKRVEVIHQINQGQSAARNHGLDCARGEYISFVDGDDFVQPNYIFCLYNGLQEKQADMAVGGVKYIKNGVCTQTKFVLEGQKTTEQNQSQTVKYLLENYIALWGKLYKRELLENLRLPVGRKAEEYAFMLRLLQGVNKSAFCGEGLYNYVVRENSDSHYIKPNYMLDNIQAIDEAHSICNALYPCEVEWCKSWLATLLYEFLSATAFGEQEKKERVQVLESALATVGGKESLLGAMQNPLDSIFYTYTYFYDYLTKAEKKTLQADFRAAYKREKGKKGFKPTLKNKLSYMGLPLARFVKKVVKG